MLTPTPTAFFCLKRQLSRCVYILERESSIPGVGSSKNQRVSSIFEDFPGLFRRRQLQVCTHPYLHPGSAEDAKPSNASKNKPPLTKIN